MRERPHRGQKPVIFVPIVASVNLRDLVASGVLAQLQKKADVDIVILTSLPITPKIRSLFGYLRVTFETIPAVEFEGHQRFFSLKRFRSFIFALSNPGLRTTRVVVGTFKSGTYGEKLPAAYYAFKILDTLTNPMFSRLYKKLRRTLMRHEIRSTVTEDAAYQKLFDRYKPLAVLCQAPYARAQIPVQRTAVRNGTHLIGIINSWDNITSSGELPVTMDTLIVWSEFMKQEAIDYLDYKPRDVLVAGAIQFDYYFNRPRRSRAVFCKALGLDPKKKIITYTLSSELLFPNEHKVVKQVADIVISDPRLKDYQLLIRIYPTNERISPYEKLAQLPRVHMHHPANAKIGEERFLPDLYFVRTLAETMEYSEVIINYPSTIILDAAIFNKPTINIHYDPDNPRDIYRSALRFYKYNHISYVADAAATTIVDNPDELREAIALLIHNPTLKLKKLKTFQHKIAGEVDGHAVSRVVKQVARVLATCKRE